MCIWTISEAMQGLSCPPGSEVGEAGKCTKNTQSQKLFKFLVMSLESKLVSYKILIKSYKIFHYILIKSYNSFIIKILIKSFIIFIPMLGKYLEFLRVYYSFLYLFVLFKWIFKLKFIQYCKEHRILTVCHFSLNTLYLWKFVIFVAWDMMLT